MSWELDQSKINKRSDEEVEADIMGAPDPSDEEAYNAHIDRMKAKYGKD